MAALSCFQPGRSHLAQPARCLADDEDDPPASFSLRRRQFIERCHERARRDPPVAREPKPPQREAKTPQREPKTPQREPKTPQREPKTPQREPKTPQREPKTLQREPNSVKRTREELVKNAAPQNVPLNRRLNIESGWSKVEEVRKKFEGAAAVNNFSRSFESPPRRRLADSLFASFKLPRKKDGITGGGMATSRSLAPSHAHAQQKRKSAVELLQETKAFYVKSETVLDRKQELPLRVSSGLGQAIAAGGCHLISSGTLTNDACCNPYATGRRGGGLRRAGGGGEGLQSTLRRLLEHADSRENVYSTAYAGAHKIYSDPRRLKDYHERETPRVPHNPGTLSGTSSSGTSGSRAQRDDRDKTNRPLSFGDARVFFPESFVIPRQRPEVVIKSAYSIPSSNSSPERGPPAPGDGPLEEAISPPAHYAHSAPRYTRSNSHSQASRRAEDACNINSHKSLPDLHAQARCYADHMGGGGEAAGRSPRRRRHSPHQRTASCSSKGTRSNHSSLMSSCEAFSEHPSPGEDNYQSYNSRCGSSFARDSGGSSGHYTQRSAPPHPAAPPHPRNDSGSSTQHEHSSQHYNYYADECYSPGALEACVVSAPPQFQDGAPSPPPAPPPPAFAAPLLPPHAPHPRVGIHFQASAPPPQFQDEPAERGHEGYRGGRCAPRHDRDYARDYARYHDGGGGGAEAAQYAEVRARRLDDAQDYVNAQQVCAGAGAGAGGEEVTSPLGTFKRQRCLRYKQRRARPVLRSKSDISDRYRRSEGRSPGSAPCEDESPASPSEALQGFFERLGLEPRQYDAIVLEPPPDSPVYFSSASTVDSNQLATVDYTVQGPGVPKPIYRNTEPPSVVERNARIIKWLCQCRKLQLQPPS